MVIRKSQDTIPLVGSINLGEQNLINEAAKVSCISELYPGHQTIYILRVKQSQMSKGHIILSCIQPGGKPVFGTII